MKIQQCKRFGSYFIVVRGHSYICSLFVVGVLLCHTLLFEMARPAQAQSGTTLGTIIVGVSEASPPFTARASNGQVVGYSIDLMRMLEQTAGLNMSYESVPFAELIPGVYTRLYDVAISCIFVTDVRKTLVDFTEIYFTTGTVLVVHESNNFILSLDDITSDMKVSATAGSISHTIFEERTDAEIVEASSPADAISLVVSGVADATIVDELVAHQLIRRNSQVKRTGGLITTDQCAIAVAKDNPLLLRELNAAINRVKTNGKYLTVYRRWFGSRSVIGESTQRPEANSTGASNQIDINQATPSNNKLTETVSGLYSVSLDTTPPTFQLIEFTPEGILFESEVAYSEYRASGATLLNKGLELQEGVWQISTTNPMATQFDITGSIALTGPLHMPVPMIEIETAIVATQTVTTADAGVLTDTVDVVLPTTPVTRTATNLDRITVTETNGLDEDTNPIVEVVPVPTVQPTTYIYPYKEFDITILQDGTLYGSYTLYEGRLPDTTASTKLEGNVNANNVITQTIIVTRVVEFNGKQVLQ